MNINDRINKRTSFELSRQQRIRATLFTEGLADICRPGNVMVNIKQNLHLQYRQCTRWRKNMT